MLTILQRSTLAAMTSVVVACSSSSESEPIATCHACDDGAPTADASDATATGDTATMGDTESETTIDASKDDGAGDAEARDTTVTTDAVGDSAADIATPETGSEACGPGPYVESNLTVSHWGARSVATVTSLGCPSVAWSVPTNSGTSFPIRMTQKVQQTFRGEVAGFFPAYGLSYMPNGAVTPGLSLVGPSDSLATKTGWSPTTQAMIRVSFQANGTTAACKVNSGATVAVAGHPEALIKYANAFGAFTGTSAEPFQDIVVLLTPTAAVETLKVTGAKAGCSVTNATAIFPGDVTIAIGATSAAELYIGNP